MAKLKIIGTSHIASQSVREIKKVFKDDAPDIVAVELDIRRAQAIFQPPQKPVLRDVFRMGVMGYLFASVGGWLQRKFGAKVGVIPGEDMRTAIRESKRHAAKLFLIDRPMELTLAAISKRMSFWEKCKLAGFGLMGIFAPVIGIFVRKKKMVDLRKVPSEDLITETIGKLKVKFPGLYSALISERNVYMARQMRKILAANPDKKVLVVVGAGHKDSLESSLVGPAVAG